MTNRRILIILVVVGALFLVGASVAYFMSQQSDRIPLSDVPHVSLTLKKNGNRWMLCTMERYYILIMRLKG